MHDHPLSHPPAKRSLLTLQHMQIRVFLFLLYTQICAPKNVLNSDATLKLSCNTILFGKICTTRHCSPHYSETVCFRSQRAGTQSDIDNNTGTSGKGWPRYVINLSEPLLVGQPAWAATGSFCTWVFCSRWTQDTNLTPRFLLCDFRNSRGVLRARQ